ncbi:MAG: hypothetical protein VX583_10775 [Bdellovibrionota bacterium]
MLSKSLSTYFFLCLLVFTATSFALETEQTNENALLITSKQEALENQKQELEKPASETNNTKTQTKAEDLKLEQKDSNSDGLIVTEKIPNREMLNGHENLLQDIHILMGLGINQSFYRNDSQDSKTELGPSLKADVVYIINQDWAVEWSGIAAFREFSDILIWDTILTLGVRKVMGPSHFFNGTWFTRYFLGYGHSVAYVDRDALSELGYDGDINRIHFGGEVVGLGTGMVWETESKQLHFFELNFGIHYLKNREAVNIQNDVPVVVANDVLTDNSRGYHIHLTYGVLLF